MTTITLTPEQVASVLAQASGQPASRPDAPTGSIDGGPMLRNGQPNLTPNMAAGSVYTMSLNIGEDENGSPRFDFGQHGSLGGSRKTVTLEKDGVVIPLGPPEQNAGSATIGLNNPAAPNNLTPGTWVVKTLFSDPGAAVLTINP